MKSNLNWRTDYFVEVKDCTVGVVYHNEHQQTFWTAYVRARNKELLQFIFDGLTKLNISAKYSEYDKSVIDIVVDFKETEDSVLGSYLPDLYENFLDKLRNMIYELIENKTRIKGEVNGKS